MSQLCHAAYLRGMSKNAPAATPIGIAWKPPRSLEYKGNRFYGPAEVELHAETVPDGNGGQWSNVTMIPFVLFCAQYYYSSIPVSEGELKMLE